MSGFKYCSPFYSTRDTTTERDGIMHELHSGGESAVYVVTAGVRGHFWVEAIEYVCHLVNRSPSASLKKKIPMEVWSGGPPTNYQNWRVFWGPVYYHVRGEKLDLRAQKAIFLGFLTRGEMLQVV